MSNEKEAKAYLIAKRAEAEARLQSAKEEIEAYDLVISSIERDILPPQPASRDRICDELVRVLRDRGEPIHRKELWAELQEKGISVGGKDPVASLGAILSKESMLFAPQGKGFWRLMEWNRRTSDLQGVYSLAPPRIDNIDAAWPKHSIG